jgi:Fe-S-cluster containining protein
MVIKTVNLLDQLPLTCSRKGTCCHGNQVFLNPWEIAQLANEKKLSVQAFIHNFTDFGGICLRFKGEQNSQGKSACNLYVENFGCSVHSSRPLACRLFPLGRQIQNEEVQYMYQGDKFPCLNGCPEVNELPKLTVQEYLKGQETSQFEQAQDSYLEVMQNLADVAFSLLLDTGLAASGDKVTLIEWKKLGDEIPDVLISTMGADFYQLLLQPSIEFQSITAIEFIEQHNELLQLTLQEKFGRITNFSELSNASIQVMAMTLYLAKSIGADPKSLVEYWVDIAKQNGAQ